MNHKSFSADMTIADGSREILVKITSNALDRDGEVLLPEGMQFGDFMKNPIVFANHEYGVRDVVGKVTALSRKGDYWLAKVLLMPRPPEHEGDWLPDTVLHMARFGIMGVSVGFQPIETRNPNKKDVATFGDEVQRIYSKWALIELSIAPLPANQDALILAVSKGLRRDAVAKMYPKVKLPPVVAAVKRISLKALVHVEWRKGAMLRVIQKSAETAMLKRRGRMYAD